MVALVAFSDDIWKARESQSLTQAELGERMGVQLLVVYRMLTLKQEARKICITNENNWLNTCIVNESEQSLLENLCAIHLHQLYDEEHLYYYNKNVEVDFYLPDEHTAIQACYNMSDIKTAEREVEALVKLHAYEPLKRAMIITRDEEKTIQAGNGLTIEIKPIWKWLLE